MNKPFLLGVSLLLFILSLFYSYKMSQAKYIIGYVSFPSAEIAKEVARKLVMSKLVACAKVINNIDSFYIYEGKFEEDKEFYLLMKSNTDKISVIKKELDHLHPYETYEFLYHEVGVANDKYAEWIDNMLI